MKEKTKATVRCRWAYEPPYKITGGGEWVNVAGGYLISAATAKKINKAQMGFSISAMAYPLNEEEDTVIGGIERVDFLIGPRY